MVLDGYIRVSQVAGRSGERFISPTVQRDVILGYAQEQGHTIGRIFEELDESGGRADRPLLLEALARQESGAAQVLAVAKLDRFARSQSSALSDIERITKAGGNFVSVGNGIDGTTPTGKVLMGFLFGFAELELVSVRESYKEAQARAVARGVHLQSTPLGYRRLKSGRLAVDEKTAPLVREVFRQRLAGERPAAIARWLTGQEVPTYRGGSQWPVSSVRSLIRRRVYLGEVALGPHCNPTAHPPLVDAATWQAAQVPRHLGSGPRARRPSMLRGLLRCAGCGRLLRTRTDGDQRAVYLCPRHTSKGSCEQPAHILDSIVEPYVEAVLWGRLKGTSARQANAAVTRAENDAAETAEALVAYRDHPTLMRTLGPDRFVAGLTQRRARETKALTALAGARAHANQMQPGPAQLRSAWPDMSVADKQRLIGSRLDCVFVFPGSHRDRIWAIPTGQAPPGLPLPTSSDLLAFTPSPGQGRALPAAGCLDWSAAKVTRALTPFMADRVEWPGFETFQTAGLGLAHANARRLMPLARWAARYRVQPLLVTREMPLWSEQRVRETLVAALAGQRRWPSEREFRTMGHGELRKAVAVTGGARRWASELGLTMSAQQQAGSDRSLWTLVEMEEAVRRLAGGQHHWPPLKQFVAADLNGLYQAIGRAGVRKHLAAKLGLALPDDARQYRAPDRWTEQAIAEALDQFLAGRDSYPFEPVWETAALGGLHRRLMNTEGHQSVARRYGLKRGRQRVPAIAANEPYSSR